ncbi:hypothetical protein NIES4103_39830 [Nostoc sp. NIES-4103]|nr:hypothetical protein NIES4103_39830 [Nostoc sp. NIES-4103]
MSVMGAFISFFCRIPSWYASIPLFILLIDLVDCIELGDGGDEGDEGDRGEITPNS